MIDWNSILSQILNFLINNLSAVGLYFLGLITPEIIGVWKNYQLDNKNRLSLQSFLKAEQSGNLAILNDLNDHFKIENLQLSIVALSECLKNPNLFTKDLLNSYLELYDLIIYYNTRMPFGSKQ